MHIARNPSKQLHASESEMCEKFAAQARVHGFEVYPETAGFDVLLVARASTRDFRRGDQVGVHAKLSPNVHVLDQALPRETKAAGPHYYGVLVPQADERFKRVACRLEISVLEAQLIGPRRAAALWETARWHRRSPAETCWVPAGEVPGMAAGSRSPTQLTPWKEKAIRLCLLAEKKGFITSVDFDNVGVSVKLWLDRGWISSGGRRYAQGRVRQVYVLVNENRPPHLLHPDVTASILKAQ